jgi:hypothetical protein
MLKKILYTFILVYIQNTHCIEPNKKNIIINDKSAVISCSDCCYPIKNDICILFYNLCKTETLKNKKFFILLKKHINDIQAISRMQKKETDLLFIKNISIYLKFMDYINLIGELNNNINSLKKANTHKSGYDLFLSLLNNKKKQPKAIKSKKNIFINKQKFDILFKQIKSYMKALSHAKNNTFIHIYNEKHKDECKNNNKSNYPTERSINYQNASSMVTLSLYPSITASSKLNTDYQITTTPKISMSTITIYNHSSSNYIISSRTSLKHLNTTNKNNKDSIIYKYRYHEAKFLFSAIIISSIVIFFIAAIFIYKYYIHLKKKNNANELYRNRCNIVDLYTIDGYHIYETPEDVIYNNTNNVIAVSYNQNNLEDSYNDRIYELPTDCYQSISTNSTIKEDGNQNENITDDSFYIENNNNELDNHNSQNDTIEHFYNILENEDEIMNAS